MRGFGADRPKTLLSQVLSTLGLGLLLAGAALGGAVDGMLRVSESGTEVDALRAATPEPRKALVKRDAVVASVEETTAVAAGAAVQWDLPNLNHDRVDYWVDRFTSDKRGEFSRFLSRSGRYAPMISAKLEERGMPQDLIYLAMIESGFNPKAYSPAHASGLWQFISETGQRYGLDINRAVDERNDPVKATDAALDYLEELHGRFGSWYLAAAGYNSGENRVGRIMREETGSERGTEEDYYRIWNRLPRETRDYVPLMVAAARISKEPARYGFDDVEMEDPMAYAEAVVPAATPLAAVAAASGTSVDALKSLNPHLKMLRTRNDMASVIRIPEAGADTFATTFTQIKGDRQYALAPESTLRRYTVRRGDNLTRIARRHGVSIRQIRSANGLRNDFIRAGSVLKIPA